MSCALIYPVLDAYSLSSQYEYGYDSNTYVFNKETKEYFPINKCKDAFVYNLHNVVGGNESVSMDVVIYALKPNEDIVAITSTRKSEDVWEVEIEANPTLLDSDIDTIKQKFPITTSFSIQKQELGYKRDDLVYNPESNIIFERDIDLDWIDQHLQMLN